MQLDTIRPCGTTGSYLFLRTMILSLFHSSKQFRYTFFDCGIHKVSKSTYYENTKH